METERSNTMIMSPPKLAFATAMAWVLWAVLANYAFLNLALLEYGFMFRVAVGAIQLFVLLISTSAWHYYNNVNIWETIYRLGFFGFILGIIIGPGNVIAHQAISESGCTLFMIATLPIIPISWLVNYCMAIEPFNPRLAMLLGASLFTLVVMYQSYKKQASFYEVVHDDFVIQFRLFKSTGITSGFFYTFYLAMAMLMFEMTFPFIHYKFDIINQIFLLTVFSFLFNLLGVFKYEAWNLDAVMKVDVLPHIFGYAMVDLALMVFLFSSIRREHINYRFMVLLRVPLTCILGQYILNETFDMTMLSGGSMLFACALLGEYLKLTENANDMTRPRIHIEDEPIYTGEPVQNHTVQGSHQNVTQTTVTAVN